MKIFFVTGTRPEIIKMAPIIHETANDSYFETIYVNAGQHYDFLLSQKIFNDLNLIAPHHQLNIGSGTHSQQKAITMILLENLIKNIKPDVVLAQGDTNTILSTALTSVKVKVPFAHIEAGLRSFDKTMPEEINRICADHCSAALFAPTKISESNLLDEKIEAERIHTVGNTIVDSLYSVKKNIDESQFLSYHNLEKNDYILLTLHREENVDNKERMIKFIKILEKIDRKIIFSMHPRTKNRLIEFDMFKKIESMKNIKIIDPLGYIDFLNALKNSAVAMSDSGGIQEESCIMKKFCITLRENTERPEAIFAGSNVLAGFEEKIILENIKKAFNNEIKIKLNPFGDGNAAKKITKTLKETHEKGTLSIKPFSMIHNNFIEKYRSLF